MEKIFFRNANRINLCGILEEPDRNREEIVIIVHGYSSSKDGKTATGIACELNKRKINSFRIDLSGCGESEGGFADQTVTLMSEDILSAINFVKNRGYTTVLLFGSSGGGLACMVAALKCKDIKKIGLKAPVSDYVSQRINKFGKDKIKEWKEKGYIFYEAQDGRRLKANYSFFEDAKENIIYGKAKNISCPVLIIHGDCDREVDLQQSKKIIKNFPNGRLIVLEGANHALEINGHMGKSETLFGDWFEGKM